MNADVRGRVKGGKLEVSQEHFQELSASLPAVRLDLVQSSG